MRKLSLGILTAGGGRVPGNKEMFRFVLAACRRAGVNAYVFTPAGVNWTKRSVKGFQYRRGSWRPNMFPLPSVVYNRVPNRQLENSLPVRQLKQGMRKASIPLYNANYFNKYDLYRILKANPSARTYLPWTKAVRGMRDIEQALLLHPILYLKPKYAFAGKGIMRLRKHAKGYTVNYRSHTNRTIKKSSFGQIRPFLENYMGRQTYIMQEAIPLARLRGRIYDIRLLVQKNGRGLWGVSGAGVRVAGKGSITTHVPSGGYIASLDEVLPQTFGQEAESVRMKVYEAAMLIAPYIESKYKGLIGEMSMDIGIDQRGRPWFFEANAKPMRFDEAKIRKVGLETLVAYVKFLSGEDRG